MILVLCPSEKATVCAREIEGALEMPVRIVTDLDEAFEQLKTNPCLAVVLDQWTCEGAPEKTSALFQVLGDAVPVTVNFAISSTDRVVRTLRTELLQHRREMQLARERASAQLMAEVKDALTDVLLSCGLALREPTLTLPVALRLRRIEEAANQIRRKLVGEEKQAGARA